MKGRERMNDLAKATFQSGIEAIINSVEKTRGRSESDYVNADGLLLCGVCGTRKQSRLKLPGIGERIVPIACECAVREYNDMQDKQRRYEREQARLRYIDLEKCRQYRFDQDDQKNAEIAVTIQKYADNFGAALKRNIGLLLYGGVGTGKTFYAGCIANKLIDDDYSVVMTSVSQIVENTGEFARNKGKKEEYEEHLYKSDLLILDDLGAERKTEYMEERIYAVVNKRYSSEKPLIVTTNLSKNDIQNPESVERKRTYDRITEMCKAIEIPGGSRRVEKSNKLQKTFQEIIEAKS